MIILLWSQCSAKAMVLKWPYAFQISWFSKDIMATCMGFQNVLSSLGMFAKRTWMLQNKFLLWCASFRKFTFLFCIVPFTHRHSSHTSLTLLPSWHLLSLPCEDIYPHSMVWMTLEKSHTFTMKLNALCRQHQHTIHIQCSKHDCLLAFLIQKESTLCTECRLNISTPIFNHEHWRISFYVRRGFHSFFLYSNFCTILEEAAESSTENALCT